MPVTLTQKSTWQEELSAGIRNAAELLTALGLPADHYSQAAHQDFPTRVPWGFVSRMRRGDPNCPLLKQVLPSVEEEIEQTDFVLDPLQENRVNPVPGLLHKYQGRVLMTPTGQCAVHCRYCFRRNFPYEANNPGQLGWAQSFRYIAQDPSIHEVILSGGDPLLTNDRSLQRFIDALDKIPHVNILRFHTRLPVVLPSRITTEFLHLFSNSRLQVVIVIHCNHPNEVDDSVIAACQKLRDHGITVLNQTVLLKGVNDNVDVLKELSYALFKAGVLPYYLHVLDKVKGTGHFDLPDAVAKSLHHDLQANLPGYLVPRLVREIPGLQNKSWL